jgi:hypothetical protein
VLPALPVTFHIDRHLEKEARPMSRTVINYDPHNGHKCTECIDALLPDEPRDYVGRHRADMAVTVPAGLTDELPTLSQHPADVVNGHAASCGSYLPSIPFRVDTHRHGRSGRHTSLHPAYC